MGGISFPLMIATDGLIGWIWLTSEERSSRLVTEFSHGLLRGAESVENEVVR